jgi:DegV family protein with EDD domain
MAIRIVTDSGADLPKEVVERYGILVVPLSMELEGNVYQDGDISGKEFYDLMEGSRDLPKTSSPAPKAFADIFTNIPTGDQIICLSLSSKLSGTFQSAQIGAELAERRVSLIDSRAATLGMGILALHAAEMAKLGHGIQEIIQEINRRVEKLRVLIFLDTAKNIVKSGRIGKLAGSLVNMLNLKLLLTNNDGEISFLTKVRGKKLVLQRLLEMMEEHRQSLAGALIGISHGDNLLDAEELQQVIVERFQPKEVIVNYMGSCIGTHAGRGGLTISFCGL